MKLNTLYFIKPCKLSDCDCDLKSAYKSERLGQIQSAIVSGKLVCIFVDLRINNFLSSQQVQQRLLSMSETEKILKALQQTVKGSSTEEIKTAEQNLKNSQNGESFLQSITLILEEEKVEGNVQMAAAVYIATHAMTVVKSKNQAWINSTAENILKLLSNHKISTLHKIHIEKALQVMLSNDRNKIIRSAFHPNLMNLLLESEKQSDQNVDFEFLVFFGQALMSNPGFTEQVWKFIDKTFEPYLKLAVRLQSLLDQVLSAQNGALASKILFLSKQYLVLLKYYLKRMLFVDIESNKLLFLPELQTFITKCLGLKLPNNLLEHSVFHLVQNPSKEQKILNNIKSQAIILTGNIIRTLLSTIKEPKLLALNPVYAKNHFYLPALIEASQEIMKRQPYYEIKDLSVLNTLDEIYSFMVVSLRANDFYHIFVQYKDKMIEDLIFRALMLTPIDYENYYQNPEEFINSLMHVIQRDVRIKGKKEEEDEFQTFTTMRTHASEFLNTFCKFQDGSLTEIMKYAFLIIDGKLNSEFSPSLMFIVVAILRDVAKDRKDLHMVVADIIHKMLNELEVPRNSTEQPESKTASHKNTDIQFSLVMILLSRYFSKIMLVNPKIIGFSFELSYKILNDIKIESVPKLLALDIIEVINHLEEGEPYSPKILATFNNLLKNTLMSQETKPSQKLLQAYFSLLKYNDFELKKTSINELVETVNIVSVAIKKEVESPSRQQIIINKLWNVIREIGQNPEFIPVMIEPIENAIMPLLPYIDGQKNLDFEEDILMLMTAFIEKSRQVTANQLQMFEMIPKIFYNQYSGNFGHSFQTMQVFIFHGSQILKGYPNAIKAIIHMALTSISHKVYKTKSLSEADNCQGALLLQSLIIACGFSIEASLYQEIADVVTKRIGQNIRYNLLKSNLVALLSLVLVHSCESFSNDVNDHLLSIILSQISSFENVKYSPKILIVSLNQVLVKTQLEFVSRRFTQIFDTVITLLQIVSTKKNVFGSDDDDDDAERDYENSVMLTTNNIINMDEFQDFKKLIQQLKENNLQLVQSKVSELPQSKKDFLKNVLGVQRVGNEPRKIFSIKRNQ